MFQLHNWARVWTVFDKCKYHSSQRSVQEHNVEKDEIQSAGDEQEEEESVPPNEMSHCVLILAAWIWSAALDQTGICIKLRANFSRENFSLCLCFQTKKELKKKCSGFFLLLFFLILTIWCRIPSGFVCLCSDPQWFSYSHLDFSNATNKKNQQQTAEEKSCSLLYFILMANAGKALHSLRAAKNVRKRHCKSTRRSAEKRDFKAERFQMIEVG